MFNYVSFFCYHICGEIKLCVIFDVTIPLKKLPLIFRSEPSEVQACRGRGCAGHTAAHLLPVVV